MLGRGAGQGRVVHVIDRDVHLVRRVDAADEVGLNPNMDGVGDEDDANGETGEHESVRLHASDLGVTHGGYNMALPHDT